MNASKLTKKQKKGLAFRERKGTKGKKQSGTLLDDQLAIPEADPAVEEVSKDDAPKAQASPVAKTTKKRKRETVAVAEEAPHDAESAKTAAGVDDPTDGSSSSGKRKKRKVEEVTGEGAAKSASARSRFILFVGNLKYTTSLDDIQKHFAKCDPPPQIRLLTPKPKSPSSSTTTKSKGCAFLEFSHRNALQQGLNLHGSTLDGRRINVELTAGGGGKSEKRVEKVKARNKHLLEERKTRLQKTMKSGGEADTSLTASPQRHSTTSGLEEVPNKSRTWTIQGDGEVRGRGGAERRGKKAKRPVRPWGTGANAIAVG